MKPTTGPVWYCGQNCKQNCPKPLKTFLQRPINGLKATQGPPLLGPLGPTLWPTEPDHHVCLTHRHVFPLFAGLPVVLMYPFHLTYRPWSHATPHATTTETATHPPGRCRRTITSAICSQKRDGSEPLRWGYLLRQTMECEEWSSDGRTDGRTGGCVDMVAMEADDKMESNAREVQNKGTSCWNLHRFQRKRYPS